MISEKNQQKKATSNKNNNGSHTHCKHDRRLLTDISFLTLANKSQSQIKLLMNIWRLAFSEYGWITWKSLIEEHWGWLLLIWHFTEMLVFIPSLIDFKPNHFLSVQAWNQSILILSFNFKLLYQIFFFFSLNRPTNLTTKHIKRFRLESSH